jgi:hypothetical protein
LHFSADRGFGRGHTKIGSGVALFTHYPVVGDWQIGYAAVQASITIVEEAILPALSTTRDAEIAKSFTILAELPNVLFKSAEAPSALGVMVRLVEGIPEIQLPLMVFVLI